MVFYFSRLGVKSRTEEKDKPNQLEESPKKEGKSLDPILEARRRKFESNEIKMKEGIIRLKPKEEKPYEVRYRESKSIVDKPKEERLKVDKSKEERNKQEKTKSRKDEVLKDVKNEKCREVRSTTPKPKESIVEVAPATTTTDDKQIDDSVPDEFKELEKLLLGGDDIELDSKVEDIFSDEDSASDNEGRFKIKDQKVGAKPPVISFTKLVNGEKKEIKSEPLAVYTKNKDSRERSDKDRTTARNRTPMIEKRETTPMQEKEKKKSPEKNILQKSLAKQRISFRTERPPPTMDKRFERKIEIKIKNPAKYEKTGKSKLVVKNETPSSSSSVDRKVNVEERDVGSEEEDDDDLEPEIVVDNCSDEEYTNINEGKMIFNDILEKLSYYLCQKGNALILSY